MAPVVNGRHLFNAVPQGYPEPGKSTIYDTSETIDLDNVPLNGGFLLKTLTLSLDPYMRVRMREEAYLASFRIGQPLMNYGVAVVIRSENPNVKVGDHLYGVYSFQEYHIKKDLKEYSPMGKLEELRLLKNEEKLPWTVLAGAGGMIGQTAYFAWKEYARPKKGDVIFITTGAGGVGSMVVQLAKRDGLRVIASASTDSKVEFMKEIGADVAFNYKTTDTREILAKEGPINLCWDNVGGEMLEAALDAAVRGATFISCGMICEYNGEKHPIKNLFNLIGKSIAIHGFLVVDLQEKYEEEFYTLIPPLLASGELKYREDVTRGLDKACEALLSVLTGTNTGKAVILVAEE